MYFASFAHFSLAFSRFSSRRTKLQKMGRTGKAERAKKRAKKRRRNERKGRSRRARDAALDAAPQKQKKLEQELQFMKIMNNSDQLRALNRLHDDLSKDLGTAADTNHLVLTTDLLARQQRVHEQIESTIKSLVRRFEKQQRTV